MKKYIISVFCVGLLCGCQTKPNPDYQFGYVTPVTYSSARYNGNNPDWGNNYRLNSSNYYGNRNVARPEMYY